jgi:hypothetical protein
MEVGLGRLFSRCGFDVGCIMLQAKKEGASVFNVLRMQLVGDKKTSF